MATLAQPWATIFSSLNSGFAIQGPAGAHARQCREEREARQKQPHCRRAAEPKAGPAPRCSVSHCKTSSMRAGSLRQRRTLATMPSRPTAATWARPSIERPDQRVVPGEGIVEVVQPAEELRGDVQARVCLAGAGSDRKTSAARRADRVHSGGLSATNTAIASGTADRQCPQAAAIAIQDRPGSEGQGGQPAGELGRQRQSRASGRTAASTANRAAPAKTWPRPTPSRPSADRRAWRSAHGKHPRHGQQHRHGHQRHDPQAVVALQPIDTVRRRPARTAAIGPKRYRVSGSSHCRSDDVLAAGDHHPGQRRVSFAHGRVRPGGLSPVGHEAFGPDDRVALVPHDRQCGRSGQQQHRASTQRHGATDGQQIAHSRRAVHAAPILSGSAMEQVRDRTEPIPAPRSPARCTPPRSAGH